MVDITSRAAAAGIPAEILAEVFAEAYRLGFAAGRDVGYAQAEADMAREWAPMAARVRDLARRPNHAELERRRWGGRRGDFSRPRPGDHPGGPKPWTPTRTPVMQF
ncbi:hypothetical protein GCM10023088_78210 [Actinomadura verrucosospora]|uniref:hypothetical protein n=1 Tax=Actinomadura verrucosospora TaxID=46165 RepID=UPI0031EE38FF